MVEIMKIRSALHVLLKAGSIVFGVAASLAPWVVLTHDYHFPPNACGLAALPIFALALFSPIALLVVAVAFDGSAKALRKPPRIRRKDRPPNMLRILAAAYADDGNFDEAIRWQTEALGLASRKWKAQYQSELDFYKAHKP